MQDDSRVEKFIVFKIADRFLGLPMRDVLKVVSSPPDSGGLRGMGLVRLGRHTIRVLELHQQFNGGNLAIASDSPPFLVITRTADSELWGIAVDEPPTLVELSGDMVQRLPESDSHADPLRMVSHTASLTHEGTPATIFLLNAQRLLEPAHQT
ncbi:MULTISPECIES: chemotaxis protein CheW [unclassified Coleofasciculus]|uniref:chemotaxis protein CheW n=1 Tax=unclassified Coleofasciculus TaxID=2692782 RepID=UPI00187EB9E6|nr:MULTISPECIES: chemotaxis protein CheW [unclassified Coleofasciculus]MBE9127884.1 chemotaxis protein CheW [Coleofasciculus sp. LEGE 07081]MBE9151076.1 chemotaxis protein CheW [Coleofasciculus sp. LEGE 07092]